MSSFKTLLNDVRNCTICAPYLDAGVRPVLQANPKARILIAGQAPGRKVHESGIPFDDASGDRLRDWLGITRKDFYNPHKIAIIPMGFCYPESGKSGDLPPRAECEPAWRKQLLSHLKNIELTLLVGKYAQDSHLGKTQLNLTDTVKAWQDYWPSVMPLPHPSPRNNIWLSKNPWFEETCLAELKSRISDILNDT
ncbi:MAG: uracil-DNA glycosylase family protein [Gammaproteobacteria bacterium]|nr:uracil-DNA glycosylase family protein [Gammaproteobacteria bacterium]